MQTTPQKICVFCGSSMGNDTQIIKDANYLGTYFATHQITLVYGAAKVGVMGAIADAVLSNNGNVIGIIPQFLKTKEVVHTGLTQLITTETMHQRKLKMQEISDAFITFPGGIGTLEELFEVLTWLQLGLHQKPIALLNSNGFYDSLISMLKTMVQKGFLAQETFNLLLVDSTLEGVLLKIKNFNPPPIPKWISLDQT
jgi:hypothetical protein